MAAGNVGTSDRDIGMACLTGSRGMGANDDDVEWR